MPKVLFQLYIDLDDSRGSQKHGGAETQGSREVN